MKRSLMLACLFLVMTSVAVYSQETKKDLFGEEEQFFQVEQQVVYSATKREQKLSDSPVAISVITAEDIARSGAQTIPELLRRVPGVWVMRPTGGQTEVAIRGLVNMPSETGPPMVYSRNILVLINGRSFFNDTYGGTIWPSLPVALSDIERIEVVRGPASALFGGNATTGVINIITKDPKKIEKMGFEAQFSAGPDGALLAQTALEDATPGFQWRLSFQRADQDRAGTYLEYDPSRKQYVPGRGAKFDTNFPAATPNSLISQKVHLTTRWSLSQAGGIRFEGGYSNGTHNMVGFNGDLLITHEPVKNHYMQLIYDDVWGATPVKLSVSRVWGILGLSAEDNDDDTNLAAGLDWESYDIEGQGVFNWSKNDILVAGFDLRKMFANSKAIYFEFLPTQSQRSNSLFLNNQHTFGGGRWSFLIGARVDSYNVPDATEVSPQFSLLFKPRKGTVWRLGYSEAIRNPFIIDVNLHVQSTVMLESLFDSFLLPHRSLIRFYGNPNLEISRIRSLELGALMQLGKRTNLDISVFTYSLSNSIAFAIDTSGNTFDFTIPNERASVRLTYRNMTDDIESYGIEMNLSHRFSSRVNGWLNATFQRTKQGGLRLRGCPDGMAELGFQTNLGKTWKVDTSLNYVGKTRVDVGIVMDQNMDIIPAIPADMTDPVAMGQFVAALNAYMTDPNNLPIVGAAAVNFDTVVLQYDQGFIDAGFMVPGANDLDTLAQIPGVTIDFANAMGMTTNLSAVDPSLADLENGLFALAYSMVAVEQMVQTVQQTETGTTDDYALWNIRISKNIDKYLDAYLAVENILDELHREYPFGEELGRRILAGFVFKF